MELIDYSKEDIIAAICFVDDSSHTYENKILNTIRESQVLEATRAYNDAVKDVVKSCEVYAAYMRQIKDTHGDYDPGNCDPAELEAIERLTKEKNECEKARKEAHDTLMHLVFNH